MLKVWSLKKEIIQPGELKVCTYSLKSSFGKNILKNTYWCLAFRLTTLYMKWNQWLPTSFMQFVSLKILWIKLLTVKIGKITLETILVLSTILNIKLLCHFTPRTNSMYLWTETCTSTVTNYVVSSKHTNAINNRKGSR